MDEILIKDQEKRVVMTGNENKIKRDVQKIRIKGIGELRVINVGCLMSDLTIMSAFFMILSSLT
jgi:hypothetical protein